MRGSGRLGGGELGCEVGGGRVTTAAANTLFWVPCDLAGGAGVPCPSREGIVPRVRCLGVAIPGTQLVGARQLGVRSIQLFVMISGLLHESVPIVISMGPATVFLVLFQNTLPSSVAATDLFGFHGVRITKCFGEGFSSTL